MAVYTQLIKTTTKNINNLNYNILVEVYFMVSNQVRLNPACSATETSYNVKLYMYMNHIYISYFAEAYSKGTDQTTWMRRLVCAFAVRMHQGQGFFWRRDPFYSGL